MKQISNLWILAILLTAVTIIVGGLNVIMHEQAHKQIDIYNGCKDAVITIGFPYATTQGIECNANPNREYLHSLNEIVGYNITSIIITLILCTLTIALIIILSNKGDDVK